MEVHQAGNRLIKFAQVGSERVDASNYFRLGTPRVLSGTRQSFCRGGRADADLAGSSIAAQLYGAKVVLLVERRRAALKQK